MNEISDMSEIGTERVYVLSDSYGPRLTFPKGASAWSSVQLEPEDFKAILRVVGEHIAGADVTEDIKAVTATIPGKVFYSEDGEILILGEDHQIISISPGEGEFNNGNPTTNHAYLVTDLHEDSSGGHMGWMPGFDA